MTTALPRWLRCRLGLCPYDVYPVNTRAFGMVLRGHCANCGHWFYSAIANDN